MENWNVILGVDVSKVTLDISCAERKLHIKIDNCTKGFNDFKKWCKMHAMDLNKTLIVMEYTGGYEHRFLQFCEAKSIAYCRVAGLEIKNSMGMVRGKNDKDDSFRISQYGEEKIKRLTPSKPIDKNVFELKHLLSFRKRLIRERAGSLASLKERKYMYEVNNSDIIVRTLNKKIKENDQHIKAIEQAIADLVENNPEMSQNYRLIKSIPGIGKINAWMTIAYTENFISFPDARKYGVFIGVIPFENTSGTSIRGKTSVSHLANKELKQELNMAARCAIRHNPELREYAERKLKTKCYSLVLNNVKFKLVQRMFSLVKRGEIYLENYRQTA